MTDEKHNPSRKLRGWELLFVALGFEIVDFLIGGTIGALFAIVGQIMILFSIATGITNYRKESHKAKQKSVKRFVLCILGALIYITLLYYSGK